MLELTGVTKAYGALRPLRIERLVLAPGDQLALLGLDQPAAEVLINLVTGASLPDTGEVRVFGRRTADITETDDWLTFLDRFGIVSDRAALLEPMTVLQNMAVPFSLQIEPPSPEVAEQASGLAVEAGLPHAVMEQRVGDLDPLARMRLRLGRALAFEPGVLLLEHPSATLSRADIVPFAVNVRQVAERRTLATLTITADGEFAGAVAEQAFALEAATGRLKRL
ncbi:MAG: hypothetical protein JSU08_00915 [Acidobacteria bacterium]|nr:hypothetical protein [Acidobacteriota bacterium]